jgi:ABC-2 type transport system ATP-binding protein
VIEVQDVTKRYGPFTAVDGVSFQVAKGDILGFLGPNGAGKTTTMRILTGYMPPTDGTARVAGFDVQEEPIEAKRRIGYLPETPPLYPEMTVRDYLTFVARIKGVAANDVPGRVSLAMEKARVSDMARKHCGKLSKGYRQRVGLAQALLHDPAVLVLDEPTAGLDPKQIIETRELIRGLGGDHTVVLSTHILPEVSQTCQRVVIINRGRVVAEDTPANLTARLQGATTVYVEVERGSQDPVPLLQLVPGVTGVAMVTPGSPSTVAIEVQSDQGRDVRRDVAAALVTSGFGLVELRHARLSLEDIFLQLTTADASEEVPRA